MWSYQWLKLLCSNTHSSTTQKGMDMWVSQDVFFILFLFFKGGPWSGKTKSVRFSPSEISEIFNFTVTSVHISLKLNHFPRYTLSTCSGWYSSTGVCRVKLFNKTLFVQSINHFVEIHWFASTRLACISGIIWQNNVQVYVNLHVPCEEKKMSKNDIQCFVRSWPRS